MNWLEARRHMESELARYPVEFLPIRDPQVEQAKFPSMVELYWSLVPDCTALPPKQERFAMPLIANLPRLPMAAVQARAFRAWPSLVRQHHFELVLREAFEMVLRGHQLDHSGLDFLIVEDAHAYGLALSVQTKAAHDWQRVKARRHPIPASLPVLDLYVDLSEGLRVGRLVLHPPSQVEEIRAWIAMMRQRICPTPLGVPA